MTLTLKTMNETRIIINGKEVKIRFGSYVISLLAQDGISLSDFDKVVKKDPIGTIAKVIYFGAVNGSDSDTSKWIKQSDVFDWMDEQDGGFSSDEVTRVFELFGKSLNMGLPKKKVKTKPKSLNPEKTTAEK